MQIQAPLHFLPNMEYFTQLLDYQRIYLEASTNFEKQRFYNRSYILGPHKIETLTVPVNGRTKHFSMDKVEISYASNWQRRNWLTIENCYRKSPFFEYYEAYFNKVMVEQKFERLADLNKAVLTVCLKMLGLTTTICHDFAPDSTQLLINYKKMGEYGLNYTPHPYIQNFGSDFVPNLSIIDVLFCKGPEAVSILKKSRSFEHIN